MTGSVKGGEKMSDYIKREDAETIIVNCANDGTDFELMMLALKDTPSADVIPRDYYDKVVEELCRKHTEQTEPQTDCSWK